MSLGEGADNGGAGEYEQALLEVRFGELAGEVREVYRRVLSLDERVARIADGYDPPHA